MIEFIRKHAIFVIFIMIIIITITNIQQKITNLDKQAKAEMERTQREVDICRQVYNANNYDEAISCYSNLVEKYENLEFRYSLGIVLKQRKKYGEAIEQFKYILENENKDEQMKADAQNQINEINKILARIKTAQKSDIGHYYANLKETAVWKDPKHIYVYIEEAYNKKSALKQAFKEWDESLYGMVDFYYTNDKDKADIVATAIDINSLRNLSKDDKSIGYTLAERYFYNINRNKVYIQNAEIYVSYNDEYDNDREESEFKGIALHEIGHALGVLSHSPRYGDIMYPDDSGLAFEYSKLSNRDINTVRKIYGNI